MDRVTVDRPRLITRIEGDRFLVKVRGLQDMYLLSEDLFRLLDLVDGPVDGVELVERSADRLGYSREQTLDAMGKLARFGLLEFQPTP